jgi:hypothetical protein
MNTDNWDYFYKFSTFNDSMKSIAQTTYEPLVNKEKNIFCKNYNHKNLYHQNLGYRPLYTKEVVKWFFDNEIKNIEKFAKKPYAPEVVDIDYKNQKIFIKWYNSSCNHRVYSDPNWPKEWLLKFKDIMIDLYNEGYYKLTMYSHCHYIAQNSEMKSIDWYGCLPKESPLVPVNCMDAIIHETAKFRLEETGPAIDGCYNMETMFKQGLNEHVLWGDSNLKFIYDEIFKE